MVSLELLLNANLFFAFSKEDGLLRKMDTDKVILIWFCIRAYCICFLIICCKFILAAIHLKFIHCLIDIVIINSSFRSCGC